MYRTDFSDSRPCGFVTPGRRHRIGGLACLLLWGLSGVAAAMEPLPYPTGPLSADEIVQQVYHAAHGGLIRNAVAKRNGNDVALVINRVPLAARAPGRKPVVQTFDTYINNRPGDPAIESQQMAILTSGKAKGTGVMFTRFTDDARGAMITMWLPALRKIRQINEPSHEDTWFGTNITYGELVLRQPEDETHELLGEDTFKDCLGTMEFEEWESSRYTGGLPESQCGHKGKPVYLVKSSTKFRNWWYDYHITEIDQKSFAPYRTVYFKGDQRIKTVVIDWQPLGEADPRVTYPRYIYAVSLDDGRDSLVYVPRETITLNVDIPDSFWSEQTLQDYQH